MTIPLKGTSGELIARMCAGEEFTMIPASRLAALHPIAQRVAGLAGALVECGVWNGGSAAVLADAIRRPGRSASSAEPRHVWLFDSWAGLPKPGAKDGERAWSEWARHGGQFNVGDAAKPAEAFRLAGLASMSGSAELADASAESDECTLHLRRGWFRDTLAGSISTEIGPIALLHVDADWYESVKLCLTTLYPLVVPGGLVILDDYGHWPGCRAAVDEYFAKARVRLAHVDYTCHYFFK